MQEGEECYITEDEASMKVIEREREREREDEAGEDRATTCDQCQHI